MFSFENHVGRIRICENYLKKLVTKTVCDCFGVAQIVDHNKTLAPFKKILGIPEKSIFLKNEKDRLKVEMHILISGGVNIAEIVRNIKDKVKWVLEQDAGILVSQVTVYVDGVKE